KTAMARPLSRATSSSEFLQMSVKSLFSLILRRFDRHNGQPVGTPIIGEPVNRLPCLEAKKCSTNRRQDRHLALRNIGVTRIDEGNVARLSLIGLILDA